MLTIVGIAGSPRRNGNSNTLLQAALDGATRAGAEASVFRLNDLTLKGCQGCTPCAPGQQCRFSDDLDPAFEALASADIWILAAPIYYDNVSGQMKLFFDRCRRFTRDGHDLAPQLPGPRVAGIIVTYADSLRQDYDSACEVLASYLKWMGDFQAVEIFAQANLVRPSDATASPGLVAAAQALGERLVEAARQSPS